MESFLVLLHTEADGSLPKIALETLGAAQALATSLPGTVLSIGFVGAEVRQAADQLAGSGAARMLGVTGPDFAQPRYSSDVLAIE